MPTVLVTGASRGIGQAIATRLAAKGWDVFAGVRTEEDATRLHGSPRLAPVRLDVTDEKDIAALDQSLPPRLDAVINNAGIVVAGPLETVPLADLRRQLDVNVTGQIAVTQAVLPRIRSSRGRIVFISSINGKIAASLLGPYCASKFAIEAAADALRLELRPWRISVVVVEPPATDTDIWRTADAIADDTVAAMTDDARRLYDKHLVGLRKMIPVSRRIAVAPEEVAAVVEESLTARRPRARYVVGLGPKFQVALITRLPTGIRDRVLRGVARQPG